MTRTNQALSSYSGNPTVFPVFARHQTFHPRYGWLKKGFDKVKADDSIFRKKDSPVVLGVGKNMVEAIKYWCIAFKLIRESEKNTGAFITTDLGERLFAENGWDPYLEDPGSLWLLHWNLMKPPSRATAWYLFFNRFNQPEFTADDLVNRLEKDKRELFPEARIAKGSLRKDTYCILRMYTVQEDKEVNEDSIDCPFTQLGLLGKLDKGKAFVFNTGSQRHLSPEIIVSACLEYAAYAESAKSMSISRLLYEPGSPGLVFRLTESALLAAFEAVMGYFHQINLSDAAGLMLFSHSGDPIKLSEQLLNHYYRNRRFS